MRRVGYVFEHVATFANLLLAARKAFRGKKDRHRVAHFYFHLETDLLDLQADLLEGTYQPKPYRTFYVHEPKRRKICAADFRDRVLHHALMNVLGPVLERGLIADTFACRVGKGVHAAVARAQHLARRHAYFLKCDVRKYFDSIDHRVLKRLLRRRLKDPQVLALLDQIIDQPIPGGVPGRGLPIGNLTSQYFANLYLGQLDHYLKEERRVPGYLRYMDDFVLFEENKHMLHEHLAACRQFLERELCLSLKERAILLAPVMQGVPFLGFRVFPAVVKLDGRKWSRFCRRVRRLEAAFRAGDIDEEMLARRVAASVGHSMHADTLEARRVLFEPSLSLV